MKTCSACKIEKDRDQFHNNKRSKDGKQHFCKPCGKDKTYMWRAKHPEKSAVYARRSRRKRLAMVGETYEELFILQSGRCAICEGGPNGKGTFHEDHDYSTGQIRGLLCSECNLGLGKFKDSEQTLQQALHYLRTHRLRNR